MAQRERFIGLFMFFAFPSRSLRRPAHRAQCDGRNEMETRIVCVQMMRSVRRTDGMRHCEIANCFSFGGFYIAQHYVMVTMHIHARRNMCYIVCGVDSGWNHRCAIGRCVAAQFHIRQFCFVLRIFPTLPPYNRSSSRFPFVFIGHKANGFLSAWSVELRIKVNCLFGKPNWFDDI